MNHTKCSLSNLNPRHNRFRPQLVLPDTGMTEPEIYVYRPGTLTTRLTVNSILDSLSLPSWNVVYLVWFSLNRNPHRGIFFCPSPPQGRKKTNDTLVLVTFPHTPPSSNQPPSPPPFFVNFSPSLLQNNLKKRFKKSPPNSVSLSFTIGL